MKKLKVFIAESVSPEDFYNRDWEGHVVEEIVRLLDGKASYRIVLNAELLCRAIKTASENDYDIFHLSCHGDEVGIRLSNQKDLSWDELADCFQKGGPDSGSARSFQLCWRRQRNSARF